MFQILLFSDLTSVWCIKKGCLLLLMMTDANARREQLLIATAMGMFVCDILCCFHSHGHHVDSFICIKP